MGRSPEAGGTPCLGKAGGRMSIRVGPAGWSYEDWEGNVYPEKRPARFDPLLYLSHFFDTIEVNSTFYRPVQKGVAQSWVWRVGQNPNFKFAVKLWRGFTHEPSPVGEGEESIFKRGLEPLFEAGVLGCLLFQFPWSFKDNPENRARLKGLFRSFAEYPKVLEVRHASWNRPNFFQFLEEEGVGFVNIDQPLIGRSLSPTQKATAPVGYVRLHGRNYQDWFREEAGRDARYNYLYSEEELIPWVERIKRIAGKAEETYVITNNHYRGKAVVNALQLKFMLTGERVKAPRGLKELYPVLEKVAEE